MPEEVKTAVRQALVEGVSWRRVCRRFEISQQTIWRLVQEAGGMPTSCRNRSSRQLSLGDREEIRVGLIAGESCAAIARRLGRPTSTVSREVNRNGGREAYRAWVADRRADEHAARPKPCKLVVNQRLRAVVIESLMTRWSPEQIAIRLVIDFPDEPEMRVSHETIYQSLFVQARGQFRKELTGYLRSRRSARKPRERTGGPGSMGIRQMINISERPAEVADRAVPGHWEGDLIMGANNRTAIVTLVERSTRYVLLGRIGGRHDAETTCAVLTEMIGRLPAQLRGTLTWDQGREMANHAEFTIATNVAVYFCDPRSPWQRGTNENTNGLLRQYFPKGTDLARYTHDELDAIAAELNGRPRQTLAGMKPSERLNEFVALTA
ncbi:MAG: IS30 family transposase [Ilumatobacteraceae bacterium]